MIRLLVCVIHYFDQEGIFHGKSKIQDPELRKTLLLRCLDEYSKLKYKVDLKVCGFSDKSLIPISIDLSKRITNPQLILYEVLSSLHNEIANYDFVIVVEDDILVNAKSIDASIGFTFNNKIDHIYHPHRLESNGQDIFNPIDIMLLPGKTGKYLSHNNLVLAEFMNPHAGFMLLSKEQVEFASRNVDLNKREKYFGGYMASAFHNYLTPFTLFRDQEQPFINYNIHLDSILFQPTWRNKLKRYFVSFLERYFCEYGKIFPPY